CRSPSYRVLQNLTQLNIEGHTALYWAIVNNRPQALWTFIKFISGASPSVYSDLRIACMIPTTIQCLRSSHLETVSSTQQCPPEKPLIWIIVSDRRSRCFLGCLPDAVQVHPCDEPTNQFDVVFQIRIFQKRLRTYKSLHFEFVAGGVWS
ncbi:uncharacterized protein F5891DRAFT_906804, partial [Suillus fuscotomentosus]